MSDEPEYIDLITGKPLEPWAADAMRARAKKPVTAEAIGGGEAERNAFKAGWRTNAVADNAENAEYHKNCEAGDYAEYQRLGLTAYLDSIVPEAPATPQPLSGDAVREALEKAREYVDRKSNDAFDDREEQLLALIDAALNHGGTQS